MSHQKAKLIFERALRNSVSLAGIDIAYDNVDYTPVANKTYLQTHLLPVATTTDTLNGADHTSLRGIFQIKIVTSSGTGSGTYADLIEKIKPIFRTDTLFTEGEFWVQVITPLIVHEGRSQDGNWSLPCHFEYRADTPN